MNLIFAIALAVFASAAPQPARHSTGVSIPLTKRSGPGFLNQDGSANITTLRSHAASVKARMFYDPDKNNSMKRSGDPRMAQLTKRDNSITLASGGLPWLGTISVGTPPKPFQVEIDTGSADSWLLAKSCPDCVEKPLYDPTPSSSSSAKYQQMSFDFGYADGDEVSGEIWTDDVSIANLKATAQYIGATKSASERITSHATQSGLLGMAMGRVSDFPGSPIFETLVLQEKVPKPVFSIRLAHPNGELYLGGINSQYVNDINDISYVSVNEPGLWKVSADNIQSSLNTNIFVPKHPFKVDTGANWISGPSAEVAALHKAFGGARVLFEPDENDDDDEAEDEYYSYSCEGFPTISFSFGGTQFHMPGESHDLGKVEDDPSQCLSAIVGLPGDPSPEDAWMLGYIFLENVYLIFDYGETIYDRDNHRVGFVPLNTN